MKIRHVGTDAEQCEFSLEPGSKSQKWWILANWLYIDNHYLIALCRSILVMRSLRASFLVPGSVSWSQSSFLVPVPAPAPLTGTWPGGPWAGAPSERPWRQTWPGRGSSRWCSWRPSAGAARGTSGSRCWRSPNGDKQGSALANLILNKWSGYRSFGYCWPTQNISLIFFSFGEFLQVVSSARGPWLGWLCSS